MANLPFDPRPGLVPSPSSAVVVERAGTKHPGLGLSVGAEGRCRSPPLNLPPRRRPTALTARQEAFVRAELIRRLFEGSAQSRYFSFVLWPVIAAIYWRQIDLLELAPPVRGPCRRHPGLRRPAAQLQPRQSGRRGGDPLGLVVRRPVVPGRRLLGRGGLYAGLQGVRAAAHAAGPRAAGHHHHGGADPLGPSADLLHLRRRHDRAAAVRAADLGRSVLPARRHRRRRLCRPSHGLCARRPSLAVRQHRARLPEGGSRPPPAGRLRRGAPRPRRRRSTRSARPRAPTRPSRPSSPP